MEVKRLTKKQSEAVINRVDSNIGKCKTITDFNNLWLYSFLAESGQLEDFLAEIKGAFSKRLYIREVKQIKDFGFLIDITDAMPDQEEK